MRISIEGNIGSGKTSLALALNRATQMPLFLEPLDDWRDGLSLFYADQPRWAATFNTQVLLSFDKWRDVGYDALFERSPQSCRRVFAQMHVDNGIISPYELSVFDALYARLAWMPDLVLYLRTDPAECMRRIRGRGRGCEREIEPQYVSQLHEAYERLMSSPDMAGIVHVLDGNGPADEVLAHARAIVQHHRAPSSSDARHL